MKKYLFVLLVIVGQCLLYYKVYRLEKQIRPVGEIGKADFPKDFFSPAALNDLRAAYTCLPKASQGYFAISDSISDSDAAHVHLFFQSFRYISAYVKQSSEKDSIVQIKVIYPLHNPIEITITAKHINSRNVQIISIENLCALYQMYQDSL
jgi:hypothetical protein